jgi:DNA polymerase III delta prime subunit
MSFLVEEQTEQEVRHHTIWAEKYRPSKLEDYVGNDTLKAKVNQYIETNDIPHLLLYGSAGTGKTTLAKLITNSIKCDVLYINASDENGIETIRVKIKNFACNIGFNPLKVIILDEADYFTPAAQAGLRNMMETFSEHTRFILTCNFHERIIEPIHSRCQSFGVTPPSKKDVAANLVNILKNENVSFDKEGVVLLVNTHYPDIRAVINTAQRNVVNGELKLAKEDILEGDVKAKIIEMLKIEDIHEAFTSIRQLLADNNIRNFADFYTVLFEKVDDYAPNKAAEVIVILADGQFQDASVVDKEICFMSTIIKILKSIK